MLLERALSNLGGFPRRDLFSVPAPISSSGTEIKVTVKRLTIPIFGPRDNASVNRTENLDLTCLYPLATRFLAGDLCGRSGSP